jgi:hypothetical protein
MQTVTSKDGTKIAFDKVGSGPAVILVNGAMSYRDMDPTLGELAELLSKDFTVYDYDRRQRGRLANGARETRGACRIRKRKILNRRFGKIVL